MRNTKRQTEERSWTAETREITNELATVAIVREAEAEAD
jgi:hypothetical protein